ncbi:MAG: glycosyltransferase [Ardenticatenia bacterium]|nr:glycosyltransferase [Ardenticatenia bacterium]
MPANDAANRSGARRLLVLMSDTGGGHRAAAMALAEAFARIQPGGWSVRLEDVLSQGRWPVSRFPWQYAMTARHLPRLWGISFRLTDGPRRAAVCDRLVTPAIRRRLVELFQEHQPDLVVSVHPFLTRPAIAALRRHGGRVPFATVVTDLVDGHALWYRGGPDALVVPTRAAAARAVALGADPARLHALGQPISLALLDPPPSPQEGRRRLGLDPEPPMVLVTAGGDGVGRLAAIARRLSRLEPAARLVLICGRNEALRARLAAETAGQPLVTVLGFVDNMAAWLHAADMVVGKAGPSSIMEALAAGRPLVLHGFLPGQENGNVRLVEDRDVGRLASSPAQVAALVRQWLAEGPEALAARQTRARAAARPAAALDIAHCLLDLVDLEDVKGEG